MIVREYLCPDHGRFEIIESRNTATDPGRACPDCGAIAEWVISAPKTKTTWASVERGGVADAPVPWALDTRPLAEGMPLGEFRAKRAKEHNDRRHAEIKAKL